MRLWSVLLIALMGCGSLDIESPKATYGSAYIRFEVGATSVEEARLMHEAWVKSVREVNELPKAEAQIECSFEPTFEVYACVAQLDTGEPWLGFYRHDVPDGPHGARTEAEAEFMHRSSLRAELGFVIADAARIECPFDADLDAFMCSAHHPQLNTELWTVGLGIDREN